MLDLPVGSTTQLDNLDNQLEEVQETQEIQRQEIKQLENTQTSTNTQTAVETSLRPVARPEKKPVASKPRRTHLKRNFPQSFDNFFVTISPDQTIKGPVLDTQTTTFDSYADTIIKMALTEAHNISKEYLQTKEYKKYYTMMLMSLVVPTQESMTLHFREVKNKQGRCSDRRNNGLTLIDQNITKTNFLKTFRTKTKPFLVACSSLKPDQQLFQLIAGGSDGSDIGIMQVSTRWHYEEYLKTKKFKSVKDSLNYGINFLHTGFKKIARNANKYPCILTASKNIDYHKLARATWGGWYNGGQAQKACRFSDTNSKHANKDKLFYQNLKNTIESGNGKPFGSVVATEANKMLKFTISQASRQAIQEISKNIESGANTRVHLNALISQ